MTFLVSDFPSLPSAKWIFNVSNSFIDKRRLDLESYLKSGILFYFFIKILVTCNIIFLKLAATRLFLGLGTAKYNVIIVFIVLYNN